MGRCPERRSYTFATWAGRECAQSQWIQPHSISDASWTPHTPSLQLLLPNSTQWMCFREWTFLSLPWRKIEREFSRVFSRLTLFLHFYLWYILVRGSLNPSPCSQELSEEISEGDWFCLELCHGPQDSLGIWVCLGTRYGWSIRAGPLFSLGKTARVEDEFGVLG